MNYSREEMEELHIDPALHNIVPMDTLRQTFFDDLDASSKVNPNRRRPSARLVDPAEEERRMLRALRANTMGRFAEHHLADGTVVVDDAYYHYVDSPRGASPLRHNSQARPSTRAASLPLHDVRHREGSEVRVARASCAVLTNIVAGALCGLAVKRVTAAVAGNICAIVVGTQLLCWLGYATVEWSALIRDTASLLLRGYRPRDGEAKSSLALKRERLLVTLTATIPRRASFWAGAAVGAVLLD